MTTAGNGHPLYKNDLTWQNNGEEMMILGHRQPKDHGSTNETTTASSTTLEPMTLPYHKSSTNTASTSSSPPATKTITKKTTTKPLQPPLPSDWKQRFLYNLNSATRSAAGSATSSAVQNDYLASQRLIRSRLHIPPQDQLLELEIRLIKSLAENDDAIEELQSLWNQSGGKYYDTDDDEDTDDDDSDDEEDDDDDTNLVLKSSSKTLLEMELNIKIGHQILLSGEGSESEIFDTVSHYWNVAQYGLEKLISIYTTTWIEPISKLAYLYTLQYQNQYYNYFNNTTTTTSSSNTISKLNNTPKKLLKSISQLYQIILSVKPWHTPALNGMVYICKERNETIQSNFWYQQCLPAIVSTTSEDKSSSSSSTSEKEEETKNKKDSSKTNTNTTLFYRPNKITPPKPPTKTRQDWINHMVNAAKEQLEAVRKQQEIQQEELNQKRQKADKVDNDLTRQLLEESYRKDGIDHGDNINNNNNSNTTTTKSSSTSTNTRTSSSTSSTSNDTSCGSSSSTWE